MPVHSISATHLWNVLRPLATFIIWCFKFSCPYTIKTLLKSKGTDTFNTAVETV